MDCSVEFAFEMGPELQLPPNEDSDRRQILEQFCLSSYSFKVLKDHDVAPEVETRILEGVW